MIRSTQTKKLLMVPIIINKDKLDIPQCYDSVLFVFANEAKLAEFVNLLNLFKEGENIPIADIDIEYDLKLFH